MTAPKPRGPGRRALTFALLLPELNRLLGPKDARPSWMSGRSWEALVRAHNLLLLDLHRTRAAHPSLHALARALGVSDTTVDGWVASGLLPPTG